MAEVRRLQPTTRTLEPATTDKLITPLVQYIRTWITSTYITVTAVFTHFAGWRAGKG